MLRLSIVFWFCFFRVTSVLSCHLFSSVRFFGETFQSSVTVDYAYFVHGDMYEVVYFPFSVISNPCFQNVYYILALVLLASAEYQESS